LVCLNFLVDSYLSVAYFALEKLDKTKQAEIKKLSDKRVVSKLTQAGCLSEELDDMDRQAMIERWAEIFYAVTEVPAKPMVPPLGYDIEFEKMKYEFQMKQWEADRAERKVQLEIDNRRLEI